MCSVPNNEKSKNQDFTLVKIVHWYGDESETKIYSIPAKTLNLLRQYLINATVADELRNGLSISLSSWPLWANLELTSLNSKQREAIAGTFIDSTYKEIPIDLKLDVPFN